MHVIIIILIGCCVITAIVSMRPMPNGRSWQRWDVKRKTDYVTRFLSGMRRKGANIKNPPLYYINEVDRFYLKDDSNMEYTLANVLTNLVRIHEPS